MRKSDGDQIDGDDFGDNIDLGDSVDFNDVIEVNSVNKVPTPRQPLPAKARGAGGVEKVAAAPSV